MGVRYPSHLYIRVDRDLRATLVSRSQEAGETVSTFVRNQLRASLAPEGARADAQSSSQRGGAR